MFLTWRLWGSLPARSSLIGSVKPSSDGQAFVAVDRELDRAQAGPVWLRDRRIAGHVRDTILAGERERSFYQLRAFVIMPNHVHLLLLPKVPLAVITRWLKGSTARCANQWLGQTGRPFWQDESYDHWVRNQEELERIVPYIESNPVSAGWVHKVQDWPWSSAAAGETACPT
jgi:putative transposase